MGGASRFRGYAYTLGEGRRGSDGGSGFVCCLTMVSLSRQEEWRELVTESLVNIVEGQLLAGLIIALRSLQTSKTFPSGTGFVPEKCSKLVKNVADYRDDSSSAAIKSRLMRAIIPRTP
jgi:hypothetical protein